RDIMAGWAHEVDLAAYDRLLAATAAAFQGLDAELDTYAASARAEVSTAIEADAAPCHDLAQELDADMFDLASPIRRRVRAAADICTEFAGAPVRAVGTPELGVMPLAALCTRALEVMEEVGTIARGEGNRQPKEAREEYLVQWL